LLSCLCAIAGLLTFFFAGVQPRNYWFSFLLVCNDSFIECTSC